ncbi:restriction endonuclease subunit S [Pseudomonas benzenivorans]|uniref:Restriction endonuclease subunit S n=1 Tax=Pseudomonas benzenivorans TaxID=556533 RepID=A0ABZ0PQH6_9PSED|nr:restriction endonuclease subunit S [Pseudomonas benzenivorans]WPC03404.1 restriction endonuclease subunit S [Pseudomonas benzenivorans]
MSSEWSETTWGEIATLEYGKAIRDYQNASGGVPVYGTNGPIGWHHTPLCNSDGVVIGRKGAYRGVHYSPKPFFVIDTAFYLKPQIELSARWAYYCLLTYDINGMDSGSAIPSTSRDEFYKLPVKVPALAEQNRIVEVLSLLDDRITLLRETNATLEAIAQALFKSWFVDFDPGRAKAEGRQPEGMDATTAALFPDSFEESELGLVPKGWEIGQLQDLLVLQRGFDLPAAERTEGGYPLIAASGPSGTHHIAMAKGPGVVTGRSGVLGKVFLTLEDYWPLNTTLWVKEFKRATPCYAFELLRLLDFASFNAGSAVPTLNRNHVHSLRYVLPPIELVKAYEGTALSIHQRVLENNRQAQTLTQLRDTLLPRLISGQLRLPDDDALLESAC